MKWFFYQKDGKTPRWTPIWLGILVFLVIGLIYMGGDIGLAFRRFGRAGLWMILGTLVAVSIFYFITKLYNKEQEFKMSWFAFPLFLLFGSILGPLVFIKSERASGIPDESGLYANGIVINCCNPDSSNYYFDIYLSNPVDSAYIVRYQQEPGYGYHPDADPAALGPRAWEGNWKHITKHAARLKGKY